MNSHKRFFLITTLAALVFAAIAVGPIFRRSVTTVGAAPPTSAVVTMRCINSSSSGGVYYVNSSDPSVTLPVSGTGCAVALEGLYAQGFTRQDAFMPQDAFFEHVLVRGHGNN